MDIPAGWCTDRERRWLSAYATGKEIIIEMGVYRGRSTTALCNGGKVICCDFWSEDFHELQDPNYPPGAWRPHPGDYESFIESFNDEIQSGKVIPMRMDLYNLEDPGRLRLIEDYKGIADMVYIDASHQKECVMSDISLARLLLKPDGLMCGHDLSHVWPGIKQALEALSIRYKKEAGAIWSERK